MDTKTFRDVKELAKNEEQVKKIDYLMNVVEPGKNEIVPEILESWNVDPENVVDMLDKATDKIVEEAKGK
jgi:hypothetical protein